MASGIDQDTVFSYNFLFLKARVNMSLQEGGELSVPGHWLLLAVPEKEEIPNFFSRKL